MCQSKNVFKKQKKNKKFNEKLLNIEENSRRVNYFFFYDISDRIAIGFQGEEIQCFNIQCCFCSLLKELPAFAKTLKQSNSYS